MRAWILGSNDGTGALAWPGAPRKCYTSIPGTRGSFAVDPFSYPIVFSDDGFCEINYRIREVEVSMAADLEGSIGADDYEVSVSVTGTLSIPSIGNERDLAISRLNQSHPRWGQGSLNTVVSVTINGVPQPPVIDSCLGELQFMVSESIEGNPFVPYYYRPDGSWLPNLEFTLLTVSSYLIRLVTLDPIPPGVGYDVITQTGGVWSPSSTPITCSIAVQTGFVITAFELTLTPVLWWEYRDSAGNNPIWNALTGAAILPNTTRGF